MAFKKIIVICIALMILTPSFSFALESEPSDSPSGGSSAFDSSPSENNQVALNTLKNSDNNDISNSEETNFDALLQEDNLESLDSEETMPMMAGVTSTGDPEIDLSSLTSISEDFSFSNDAYLTSLFSGAAVYTYPIDVPKGIAGFQPKIELTYNSQSVGGTYGWLGDGWSLNEYYILRDVNYTPNNISDDRFKLIFDGQSHDLVYSATGGFYHTEIETYMKIQKEAGGSNQKGEYWTVTTKDGTVYRFGYTSDSELLNSVSGRNYVTKWKLDQINDVNGNSIVYNYVKNPVNGEIGTSYLSNISYNNGFNVIEFERANKPVVFKEYKDGSQVSEKCLLSTVSIKADSQLVYKYQIQYVSDNHVLLNSISLIGTDSISLPATTFSYSVISNSFVLNPSWSIPSEVYFYGYDMGALFVDINGDGLPDIVQSNSSSRKVWINTGNGFVLDSSWSLPSGVYFSGHSQGVLFVDINGDGLPDIVQSNSSSRKVWINTGSGFVLNSSWSLPSGVYFNGNGQLVLFIDINGDGLPDIVHENSSGKRAWINTGSGFVLDSSWSLPSGVYFSGYSQGALFVDINGDGLPDIVQSNSSSRQVWINTGSGFVLDSSWSLPSGVYFSGHSQGVLFVDINGDGLPDIVQSNSSSRKVWINTGSGFVLNSSWSLPSGVYFNENGQLVLFIDINGDGLPDIVHENSSGKRVWINSPNSSPNLLTQINHSSGAVTKIEYDTSTKYNNTQGNGKQGLPIPIKIVKKVEISNGMKNDQKTVSTLTYDYKGGLMHIEPKGKTEFRGFLQVTVTDGRSVTEHSFHQDEAKKGKEYLTITKSTTNELYSKTENNFIANSAGGIFEVLLNNTSTSLYDGQTTPVISKINYEFDAYGNVISIFNEGDLSLAGDETTTLSEYTYNTSNWILNKVKKETIKDANLQTVAEVEFHYDGHSNLNAVPTRGLITETIYWNNEGDDILKEFDYDSFGNLISQTEGSGHTTTLAYGANPIFPLSFTNALGQTTLLEYNLSIGKLEKTTDSNGFETSMEYDGFGRIKKVIKPGDISISPTIQYQYFLDGQAPEYIQISTKKQGNEYYDIWNYYDGLKRVIKTEADSDNPSQKIITETYYDNYGSVSKIIAPRIGNEPALETMNQYDSFGRVIQVTNPDGSSKHIEYNQLKTVSFDENGHIIQIDKDIYGNIVKVTEFNGNEIYETCYEYDAMNQLIKIIPNQYYDQSNVTFLVENSSVTAGSLENTTLVNLNLSSLGTATPINTTYKVENTTFVYDSLGRQVMMDDPDLGVWTYTYTPTNKIASQTDARGVTIEYEYDALDRLILINYPNDDDIIYEYDNGTIGTLSQVQSGIVTKSYSYDSRLRIIEEAVSIEGVESSDFRNGLIAGAPSSVQSNTNRDENALQSIDKSLSNSNPEKIDLMWMIDNTAAVENSEFNQSGQSLGSSLDQSAGIQSKSETAEISNDFSIYNRTKETYLTEQTVEKTSQNGFESNGNGSNITTEERSVYNRTDGDYLTSENTDTRSVSSTEITETDTIYRSFASGLSITGSFVNQQDITLQLEEEGYRVQRVDLTNLRVSMGAGDVGYIYLNNHNILKFVDSSAGGNLYIYDDAGNLLANITKVNGKPSFENMTFDVSFIHDGAEMFIEIQKYNKSIPDNFFSYSYVTDEDILTLRAYLAGYQSNVDYISSEYAVEYETLPSIETSVEGSFENQQDITLQLEQEGFSVRELDLANLRVSMGAGDVGRICLNDCEILRFVDNSGGGILYIFDENGSQLGTISVINGKNTFENVTFNISFVLEDSDMLITIEKFRHGLPNGTFNYSYAASGDILTMRAYMTGYQSGVDYISSEYAAYYEPRPVSTAIEFENEEYVLLSQKGFEVTELQLTNLRVATGAHDVGYVSLNDLEFLRFIDTPSGGTLIVFDGDGNELDFISEVNGHKNRENVTFDISFVRLDETNLSITLNKNENGIFADSYSYVCSFEKPILCTQMYLYGYESHVNYISGVYDAVYVPYVESMKGSFTNEEDITISFEKEDFDVKELDLTNLRVSMGFGDIGYVYLNDYQILKFVDTSAGGTLYVYDENGIILGTIAKVNGNTLAENMTFDISFVSIGSDISVKIEKFWKGQPNSTNYYSYMASEPISTMRAYLYGYQSNVNYMSSSYNVDYDFLIPDLPTHEIPDNSFENEGDITIYMENTGNLTVRQIDLTDLRMQANVTENAYIALNDNDILRFENTALIKSLVVLDSNGNAIDVIEPLNISSPYENVTFNVSFVRDNQTTIHVETNEKGTVTGTYQYSYDLNEPISSLKAYVDTYESDKSFVSSSYDIYYGQNITNNTTNNSTGDSSIFITTYVYDSMDRITQKTLPNGKVITYNYNNQTLLSSIPGIVDNIEYNSMNLMTRKEFSNNVATDLTYDGWTKRLENIDTPDLQNIDYAFDLKGNIVGITDNIIEENQYFFYDDLDRLILAGSENYSQSFAYNPLGSILAHRNKDVVTNEETIFGFEYGKNAGIHAPTRVGDTELLYDANGNLIEDGDFIYIYNDANRLTEVLKKSDNNNVVAEFVYDENGKRIKKTEEGVVYYYISSDYDIENGEETVYYSVNGKRMAKESSEGMFWYLDDHLGSTNVMIDEQGELVERTLYYPFGAHREGGTEKYTFTGKEFDSEIGLYYFEARYYNPTMFIFTQADSVIPSLYNPQTLNRYSYCHNNPTIYIDSNGHWSYNVHKTYTQSWAKEMGFAPWEAQVISWASISVDFNYSTAAGSISEYTPYGDRSWHINLDERGDSRLNHANDMLNIAIEKQKDANTHYNNNKAMLESNGLLCGPTLQMIELLYNIERAEALWDLGNSLHPAQDVQAHGNITGHGLGAPYDNINYDWDPTSSGTIVVPSNNQERLKETEAISKERMGIFQQKGK